MDGKVWLIGGITNWTPTSSVLIYDIDADSWGTGPALPRAAMPRATTLDGEIFVNDDGSGGCWVCRNGAWVDAVGGPMPRVLTAVAAVEWVTLG